MIIEIPSETLNNGKIVRIEKIDSKDEQKPLGNIQDLYNQSTKIKDIFIKIPQNCLQRGKTIVIQKEKIFIIKSDDYQKENHHLNNNIFSKRDHLQSKSIFILNKNNFSVVFVFYLDMMEIKIEIPPEFFNEGQTITLRNEDPQLIEKNFPYHRPSKPDL